MNLFSGHRICHSNNLALLVATCGWQLVACSGWSSYDRRRRLNIGSWCAAAGRFNVGFWGAAAGRRLTWPIAETLCNGVSYAYNGFNEFWSLLAAGRAPVDAQGPSSDGGAPVAA